MSQIKKKNREKTMLIKKYENRKFYNTEISAYITLDEISQLIKDGNTINVIDHKTKKDITCQVYKSIIANNEQSHESNPEVLLRVIKSFNSTYSAYIGELEQEVGFYDGKLIEKKENRAASQFN